MVGTVGSTLRGVRAKNAVGFLGVDVPILVY